MVMATPTNFWEPVEGEEGVTPEPSSLRETTKENEGCRATPMHRCRRPKQPDATSRQNVAIVDGGLVVTLVKSRSSVPQRRYQGKDKLGHLW